MKQLHGKPVRIFMSRSASTTWHGIVAAAVACVAACASTPSAIETGVDDRFALVAVEYVHDTDPSTGQDTGPTTRTMREVQCVLANDKGEWHAQAPGRALVARSTEPLNIRCFKEGYEDWAGIRSCAVRSDPARTSATIDKVMLAVAIPAMIALGPYGLSFLPQVVGAAGEMATAPASATTPSTSCTYGVAFVEMRRK